jgi:adenine-specific DNA-methyltransferase
VTKGFVPTPAAIVDLMVDKLFRAVRPKAGAALLDPGCGEGEFIEGVIRRCGARGLPLPQIVGVEADVDRARTARKRFASVKNVRILQEDFLCAADNRFDYIVGNPPYVPITGLGVAERERYRRRYLTAKGRFDLYLLFFEQALQLLQPGGTLVFITPEKFTYVDTARPLRELLLRMRIDELHFLDESTFGDLVTYPLVSTITAAPPTRSTRVVLRSGVKSSVQLRGSSSWLPPILGHTHQASAFTLSDACVRISCGVATGADAVFVMRDDELPTALAPFAHATISGRQITKPGSFHTRSSMLVPYDMSGRLLPETQLKGLGRYLSAPARRAQLLGRTCAAHKPWYAFHENPPMREVLRPKLICKDITQTPFFVVDREGDIIPRHSTYYIVPDGSVDLEALADHVNSPASGEWLRAHCQRAANGFLRLQSQVLKRLPVPASLVPPGLVEQQLAFEVQALPA